MTDQLIERIKRDRNQGHPVDDWCVKPHDHYPGFLVIEGPSFTITVFTVATNLDSKDYADGDADARRIARVPDMESRILADAEVIKAAEELADILDRPAQSDGDLGRYHYDWNRVDAALYAFRKAQEGRG
jgi:hypothetical protein